MKLELQRMLKKRFKFLNPKQVDSHYPYPMFGFDIGDGWYDLIYELFEKIEKEINKGKAFYGLTQVKEKFGLLRIYTAGNDDKIYDLISKYEEKSAYICETCGKRGKLRCPCGWMFTACKKHYEEYCIERLGKKLTRNEEKEVNVA